MPSATRSTSALLEEARRSGAPVLGICRGLQVVNVALGGTLVQDIPTERPSPVVHERSKAEKTRRDHHVSIAPGTRLAAIAGVPEAAVNSRHHQAIEPPRARARGVGARARRRCPRRSRQTGAHWLVAVQWHPENLGGDPVSGRLFAEFLRAARDRAGAKP